MEELRYKTEVFEGPLDLLLHLIAKHKLNIYDIPISELVEQYTDYVKKMQEENMELASEFLSMAARLVYIKTVSLLPVYDEAEQLKKELTGELIEYRDCKLIAEKLSGMTDGFLKFSRDTQTVDEDMTYSRIHDALELYDAYINAAGKKLRRLPPPEDTFKDIVKKAIVSVSDKMNGIYSLLRKTGKIKLDSIFNMSKSRSELVASFLAVLEMARKGSIYLDGTEDNVTAELDLSGRSEENDDIASEIDDTESENSDNDKAENTAKGDGENGRK